MNVKDLIEAWAVHNGWTEATVLILLTEFLEELNQDASIYTRLDAFLGAR